jgi:3-isopropylmalate/(R)-2-methylmalate dehydratase large subunit
MALTLLDKIWRSHAVATEGDEILLYVDRTLVHEGSFHAFDLLAHEGRKVRRPDLTFGFADHYVPTVNRAAGLAGIQDPEARDLVALLERNARDYGFQHFGMSDPDQGIVHVVGPELGLVQPGAIVICNDSHTSTHGALGAYAVGVGASDLLQTLASQCRWERRPKAMRINLEGELRPGVGAKDVILAVIAKIGIAGAVGHAIEYAGRVIREMSIDQRMTICNMSIEAGARAGMVAPDATTFEYLAGRRYSPRGDEWTRAVEEWAKLSSDRDARFDKEVTLHVGELGPMVTWGTLPDQALPIDARIPHAGSVTDPKQRKLIERALDYMDLSPGTPIEGLKIDRVFIGSCTNARIEDLREAAAVACGRKARVPTIVSPGSNAIKRQAEEEGLDRVFSEAGFEWRAPGCSMCVGFNGDLVRAGERCASTSNRNFEGRQGKGSRTHLVSPGMAAAAAVAGELVDVRNWS